MNWKSDSPVGKASNLKVEPTLGVAFVVGTLSVAGGPETVVIVSSSDNSMHIAWVEPAIEEDLRLAWLCKLETVSLGQIGTKFLGLFSLNLHFKTL